jgi:hypothetical protein
MLTRSLAVATALLAALVLYEYNRIGQLRAELARSHAQSLAESRALAAASMEGQGAEIRRAMIWLNDFYRSPDGLARPDGLWIDGHPDFEGLSAWVFEVYLRSRLNGLNEEQARDAVVRAIRQSDEWRAKHRT